MVSAGGESPDQGPARRQVNFNTVAALAFIAFALILFVIIPSQIDEPILVLADDSSGIEPTLFPRLVASGFLIFGIWFLVRSLTLRQRNQLRDLDREAIVNVLTTLAVMAAYVPLMMGLGFVVGSALVIAFLSTFYGNRSYHLTAIICVVVPISVYFTFTKLLATYLPPFPIDTILTRNYIL